VQEGHKGWTVIKFCFCFAPAQATGGLIVCHFDSGARPRADEKAEPGPKLYEKVMRRAEVKQRALIHAVSYTRVIVRKPYEARIEYE
jgi:hypothetical protein